MTGRQKPALRLCFKSPRFSAHDALLSYRGVVVTALVVTIWITLSLRDVRLIPPILPAFPLPAMSISLALIEVAIGALFVPIPGAGLPAAYP